MPAQYRYGTTFTARPHTCKQFPRARQTVKLTTQARKAITADQRARRAAFDNDVAKIWQKNMDACEELAVKHKKTLRRCYDAIFLGAKLANGKQKVVSKWKAYVAAMVKQVNADLGPGQKKVNALDVAKTHREQYQETPMDELQQYVQELTESKKEKNYGRRVTAKSKVMDVHHTFEELKGILTGLDARVGVKAMVFLARASTEYNQAPLFYATDPAAAAFLPKVYMLDVQDFMTRFEGYSIAGGTLAGMAGTYKDKVKMAKAEVAAKLRHKLREITGDPKAHMEYKKYHQQIVVGHSVELIGWPHSELKSPSSLGNSLPVFLKILDALDNGSCKFRELTQDEVAALDDEYKVKVANGELPDAKPRKIRSDAGKSKKRKRVRESDQSDQSEHSSSESSGTEADKEERMPKKKRRQRSPAVRKGSSKSKEV